MKRPIVIGISIIVLLLVVAGAIFYWNNLRGASTAFRDPKENISDLIDRANQNADKKPDQPAENQTGMPLTLPNGFRISVFAKNLPNARVLRFDPQGRLLVSEPAQGKVVALLDTNNDQAADQQLTIAQGLNKPHGMVFDCGEQHCALYIAEEDKIMRYDYDAAKPAIVNATKIADLPAGGNHTTRTLWLEGTGESLRLLVAIGSSCNVCYEKDERRTKIYSMNTDGSNLKPFAIGLRNSVFMNTNPIDGKIWATEMGRDLLGDNLPPDEVNIIEEGKDYGFPICYGNNVHDDKFDTKQYIQDPCTGKIPARIDLPAHSAPLGLTFVPEEGWPEEYRNDLLIAFHGSWNRSEPTGYKIVRFDLDDEGNVKGSSDFISGWLKDGRSLGRPVDLLAQPGGTLYISDDKAGVIYKLSRLSLD